MARICYTMVSMKLLNMNTIVYMIGPFDGLDHAMGMMSTCFKFRSKDVTFLLQLARLEALSLFNNAQKTNAITLPPLCMNLKTSQKKTSSSGVAWNGSPFS
jgi:hypothetical protein